MDARDQILFLVLRIGEDMNARHNTRRALNSIIAYDQQSIQAHWCAGIQPQRTFLTLSSEAVVQQQGSSSMSYSQVPLILSSSKSFPFCGVFLVQQWTNAHQHRPNDGFYFCFQLRFHYFHSFHLFFVSWSLDSEQNRQPCPIDLLRLRLIAKIKKSQANKKNSSITFSRLDWALVHPNEDQYA